MEGERQIAVRILGKHVCVKHLAQSCAYFGTSIVWDLNSNCKSPLLFLPAPISVVDTSGMSQGRVGDTVIKKYCKNKCTFQQIEH